MRHLDTIEKFINLVEKVSNLYGISVIQAHSYVLNFLKGSNVLDKENLENNCFSSEIPKPKTNQELAEYVANHIRISPEDMLTIIEGIESGYNLNDNPIYAIAHRDRIINLLKSKDNQDRKESIINYYTDLTFKKFNEKDS